MLRKFSGDLQSLSWSAMALGGICGSLLGGYTLSSLRTETIFLLFSLLPSAQLLSCVYVKEAPSEKTNVSENGFADTNDESDGGSVDYSSDKVKHQITRRRNTKHKKGKKVKKSTKYGTKAQQPSVATAWHESLKLAFFSLCRAFRQPMILRPMAWFFFSHIAVPNLSTVMFYYQTEVLHLEASFLGTARVIGWLGLMLGTYIYNTWFKHMKLRRVLMIAHFGLAAINVVDIALVSRSNVRFGIPDKYMVLGGSAMGDAINQFKMMPFLILSGQLCPPGIEGTLFALFMSINNLGNTVGSFFGAALASILDISSGSYHNLAYGLTVQLVCTLLPVGFLFLIPKEATGVTAD